VPSILKIGRYLVFFWSGDTDEPIHVHVAQGKPSENATKIWLTAAGGCIVSHNKSRIPEQELNDILKIISDQFFYICDLWKSYFETDTIKFYC
jgi:hypothetical protein